MDWIKCATENTDAFHDALFKTLDIQFVLLGAEGEKVKF